MVGVEWGAEIYGGCPSSVDEDTPVMNKDRVEVPASCWMQEFEPYKLHANHAYYGNRAEPANNELAELRAFKEAAIAKYPDLGPVDPDVLQARKIALKFALPAQISCMTSHRTNQGEFDDSDVMAAIGEAMDWARANPR